MLLDIEFSATGPVLRGRAKVAPCLLLFNSLSLWSSAALAAPPSQPEDARGSLALYCPDECAELALEGVGVRTRLPKLAASPTVVVSDVTDTWTRPDADTLSAYGEGNVGGMADAGQIVLIEWASPREQAAATLATMLRIAVSAGPWIEDPATGRLMSTVAARGLAGDAAQDSPDVATLISIEVHQAESGASLLATRGLLRLGLPDLVEVGVPDAEIQTAAARLNAIAQALFETGVVSVLEVDAERFASATARQAACQLRGTASLAYDRGNKAILGAGLRASIERFDGAFGACAEEPELAALVPVEQPVAEPEAPVEDTLATVRARSILRLKGEVHQAFEAGLPKGDRLLVKAPFQAADGRVEWLWLEVAQWAEGDVLVGTLSSPPTINAALSKGDTVQTSVGLVFDYLWVHADGSTEGNETQQYL